MENRTILGAALGLLVVSGILAAANAPQRSRGAVEIPFNQIVTVDYTGPIKQHDQDLTIRLKQDLDNVSTILTNPKRGTIWVHGCEGFHTDVPETSPKDSLRPNRSQSSTISQITTSVCSVTRIYHDDRTETNGELVLVSGRVLCEASKASIPAVAPYTNAMCPTGYGFNLDQRDYRIDYRGISNVTRATAATYEELKAKLGL